jgi:glycosyltransferase 2 family protein
LRAGGAVRRAVEIGALAAGVGAIALLCWRFGLTNLRTAFAHVSVPHLVAYVVFACAVRFGYGLRWDFVMRTLGSSPGLGWLVVARVAGDAVSALLPIGRISGDPVRVALVSQAPVGTATAGASVAMDRVMEVVGNMLCTITYVTVFSAAHTFGSSRRAAHTLIETMLLLLAALAVALVVLRRGKHLATPIYGLARRSRSVLLQRCVGACRRVEDQLIRFLQLHPGAVAGGILGSLCIEGLQVLEYYFLLAAFGITLDLPTLLMALVATGLAHVVPTPAGLGALEAGQVTVLAVASNQPDLGFVVGIVMRLHETLWTAVGLLALSARGVSLKRLRLLASADKVAA